MKKILICDDDRLVVRTLVVVLDREGYQLDTALDGNIAMDLLNKNEYDLLLLDIHFPFHSGLELLRYVRSDLGKATPVLILSAFSDIQMQSQAKELGIDGYIIKPFNPTELVQQIRSAIKN